MKKIFFLILVLVTIAACKNETKTENEVVTIPKNKVQDESKNIILEKGCFEYNNNGNTIKMEITEVSEKVTGNLDIVYAEKDSNHGTFVGKLNNDKLIGVYTFHSEGIESSREMAFLVKGNQLIEGYGELNNDGTKFKDTTTIKYTSAMPLTKVDCKK
jgi:hypothetical protein